MATRAGEQAPKTLDIYCEECGSRLHVDEGDDIPACPNCDNDTYDSAVESEREVEEPARGSGSANDEPM